MPGLHASSFSLVRYLIPWLSLLLLVSIANAQAPEEADATPTKEALNSQQELNVKWFRPEFTSEVLNGHREIVLSGRTQPHARITLKNSIIPMFRTGSKKPMAFRLKKEWVKNIPTRANADGLFRFSVFLPEGQFQIPAVVISPKSKKKFRVYQISLAARKDEVLLRTKDGDLEESPFLKKKNRLSLGLGANYLLFQENIPDEFNLSFETFKGPAYYLEYWRLITKDFHFLASFKSSPGETTSGSKFQVEQGGYNWVTFTSDVIYLPWSWRLGDKKTKLVKAGGRVGLQYHIVPFIPPGPDPVQVETNEIIMATLGYHVELYSGSRWLYEMYMRYQMPVASGSLFELTPNFAFDGSIGARYTFRSKKYALGAYWYGHWLAYGVVSEGKSGEHGLFFSNLELRLSYQF